LSLQILLAALGVAAVAVALSILLLGAATTAAFTEAQFDALTRGHHPHTGRWPATMDSELRFYAPFWGAYGLLLLHVARGLPGKLSRVPPLAALFFAGGVGRAISYIAVGAPHPAFTLLMAIELVLPPVLLALWWRAGV
jgi:hypothetical protein